MTVADLSPAQLEKDRLAGLRYGLVIERVLCDAMDIAALRGRSFDLVYQPVSSLYLPDVSRCYREVAALLPLGGLYWSEHWNPVEMQLDEAVPWDGAAYRLVRPQGVGPIPMPPGSCPSEVVCWHYVHSLSELLGSLCDAGFVIRKFDERPGAQVTAAPGTRPHLGAFIPAFFSVLAERIAEPGSETTP